MALDESADGGWPQQYFTANFGAEQRAVTVTDFDFASTRSSTRHALRRGDDADGFMRIFGHDMMTVSPAP